MLRNEIQIKTGLTRKAIEYYEEKGFIHPLRDKENGYRIYLESDVEILNQISMYKKLGLTLSEIESILQCPDTQLSSIVRKKQYQLELDQKRKDLLKKVMLGINIDLEISQLEREENIYTKLERIFPGYFGQCFFAAYRSFLDEPIADGGEEAYKEFVDFLDQLPKLNLSTQEQAFIEETMSSFDMDSLNQMNKDKLKAIENAEEWLENNKEIIEEYQKYKESEDYHNSLTKQIFDKLNSYMIENHYYEVAIPLIGKFSKSYDLYYQKLLTANEIYLKKE